MSQRSIVGVEKRIAGDRDRKGLSVSLCVSLLMCPLEHPMPVYSVLSAAEADRPCTVSLRGLGQGRHRQTAAIKPWLFQVHRVWKGLIEGLWSQWGWSFSPLFPSTSRPPSLEGGRRVLGRRRIVYVCVCVMGGCCRHHVTHVSCWAD